MTNENTVLLELSTAVHEGFPFIVDGVRYRFRTMSDLSKVEEGRLHLLTKREQQAMERMNKADPLRDERYIERISDELRGIRIDLVCMMTDLPRDVCERLSVMGHMKILEYIGKEPAQIDKEIAAREDPFGVYADLSFWYGLGVRELTEIMPGWLVRIFADELPRLLAQHQEMMNAAAVFPYLSRHQRAQVNARLHRVQRVEAQRPATVEAWEQATAQLGIPIRRLPRKEPAGAR